MIAVYETLEKIKDKLRENPSIQTVTIGDLKQVDLAKTSIFPIAHVVMGNVSFRDHIIVMNLIILFLDIVDEYDFDVSVLFFNCVSLFVCEAEKLSLIIVLLFSPPKLILKLYLLNSLYDKSLSLELIIKLCFLVL